MVHVLIRASLTSVLLLACGPAPATTDPTTTDTGATGTSSGPGTTSMSPTPNPTEAQGSSTTSSGSTTGTHAESSDSDSTCGFICDDTEAPCQLAPGLDGQLRCVECDPWAQDCPKGQKCTAWASDGGAAWDANRCVEVATDPHKPGEPCTVEGSAVSGIDDCELASMCWNVDPDTLTGTCVALCEGSPRDPTCPEPNTLCRVSGSGVLNVCLPTCNPLAVDCPQGQVCVDSGFGPFTCVFGSPGPVGAPCEFVNACDPGLACIPSELVPGCDLGSASCCSPYCSLAAPACPDGDEVCQPWFEQGQAPAGYEDVGVCALPN